jgi:hypothetical protein
MQLAQGQVVGKPSVSKYVTVGFDSDAKADKFKAAIEGNGLLVRLYETFKDDEGNKKGRVNSIQARSAHIWTPTSWERRRFEFGGVTIEFKDQLTAMEFLHRVAGFLSGEFSSMDAGDGTEQESDSTFHEAAVALALLLKPANVAGAKFERD